MYLVLADKVPDGRIRYHDLEGNHPAAAYLWNKLLRYHTLQNERELRPDLRLLVGREHVYDTVHGLGRGIRMQRGERQVACFRDGKRGLDGFQVAHLAHKHHVRVLAQNIFKRVLE